MYGSGPARLYGKGEVLIVGTPALPPDLAYSGVAGGWLEPVTEKARDRAPKNRAKPAAPKNRRR